jgi:hypothetical protein
MQFVDHLETVAAVFGKLDIPIPPTDGRLAAMSMLLRELQAFYLKHEYRGELDGGVEGDRVWMTCSCGALISRTRGKSRVVRLFDSAPARNCRARRTARGAESLACGALFPSPWRR